MMAITIELWCGRRLVDGVEMWWDDMAPLLDRRPEQLRMLSSVDPYGDLVLRGKEELNAVAEECELLVPHAPHRLGLLLTKLGRLARAGAAHGESELRFVGD
jgi:hypothetical protein